MELTGMTLTSGFTYTPPPPENTAAWFGGAYAVPGGILSTVDRITFATDTATASVRGPLSLARNSLAAASNFTDGWFGGGSGPYPIRYSTVNRITFATDTATASVRGPLSAVIAREGAAGGIQ